MNIITPMNLLHEILVSKIGGTTVFPLKTELMSQDGNQNAVVHHWHPIH